SVCSSPRVLVLLSVLVLASRYFSLARSSLTATPAPETYTLSLHDALPICRITTDVTSISTLIMQVLLPVFTTAYSSLLMLGRVSDRKSTRLNSSHVSISYAVFCLKKKKNKVTVRRQPGTSALWLLRF